MAWVWLTDEEIQTHLDAGTQKGFLLAIEALHYRLEFGEMVRIKPLRADLLSVCTDEMPRHIVGRFVDYVLGVEEIPSLPAPDNWREIMRAVCRYFETTGIFSVAQIININDDAAGLVGTVMALLEKQVADTPDDRLFFPGYFLDELIDGEQPVWDAAMAAMDQWPVTPKTRRVISVIIERLDEPRQARWRRPSAQ